MTLHPSSWPWWAQALAVYLATRLWSAAVFLVAAAGQPASYWGPDRPGYATFTGLFWDASWYRTVAEQGYPPELPRDPTGNVQQNAWAFLPLFPLLVRAGTALTGVSWATLAPSVALVLGALAALVLDRLVQGRVAARHGPGEGRRVALGTVLLVGLHPAAPVLQAAYPESFALLLLVLALWLLVRRRYVLAMPAVLALGFTRPVALPVAAAVAVHLAGRWRDHRRRRERLRVGEGAAALALLAVAVLAGVAWPALAGLLTGVPDAYLRTQAAWRGTFSSAPVVPWLQMAEHLMGVIGLPVLVLVVAGALGLALSPPAAAAGREVQTWGVAYLAYLVLVAFPHTSLVRFLLLAFPLAIALAVLARRRWALALLALAGALGQVVWVWWLWQLTGPTGWPP